MAWQIHTAHPPPYWRLSTVLHFCHCTAYGLYINLYNLKNWYTMADFRLWAAVNRSEFKLCGPNFAWPQLRGMIYFHDNIWNHCIIYYYSAYIHHYMPVVLLLCYDNIKDWSIQGAGSPRKALISRLNLRAVNVSVTKCQGFLILGTCTIYLVPQVLI